MSSVKRKMPIVGLGLQRRVRPRFEPEPESDIEAPSEDDVDSGSSDDEKSEGASSDAESEEDDEDEEASSEDGAVSATQLSFGVLARAQASLPPGRKPKKGDPEPEEPSRGAAAEFKKPLSAAERREKLKRSSKHAPAEMTSKKQVSRRREFIEVPTAQARDPRFMPLGAGSSVASGLAVSKLDEIKARKAYAFLDDYEKDEMNELRAAIKKERDPASKERLQRALLSMESKRKAQARKDSAMAVIEEHRKKEKELVKQGKTPFYLKKSEQKQRVLVEQFAGLKKGQVDKAIERRRKKVDGKEKKKMPFARRMVGNEE
ncbi:hypothetical protein B0T25DRAFT_109309 [Lasiosphaeria hispida]|uniref:rRNA biogenesis protein RRP36 n=1 Tax=Lasiosphaeria hispida TaxID=260671 RepID=A0AAJ0HR34_9PEZI|nr:hypothetical protein B0T25DRAFT_109309 [Lasiosphaeria hispida]